MDLAKFLSFPRSRVGTQIRRSASPKMQENPMDGTVLCVPGQIGLRTFLRINQERRSYEQASRTK
jgi:hypothetical protein